jgi:hypothetical protein
MSNKRVPALPPLCCNTCSSLIIFHLSLLQMNAALPLRANAPCPNANSANRDAGSLRPGLQQLAAHAGWNRPMQDADIPGSEGKARTLRQRLSEPFEGGAAGGYLPSVSTQTTAVAASRR